MVCHDRMLIFYAGLLALAVVPGIHAQASQMFEWGFTVRKLHFALALISTHCGYVANCLYLIALVPEFPPRGESADCKRDPTVLYDGLPCWRDSHNQFHRYEREQSDMDGDASRG
jgi:hypothetical protein